MPVYFIQASAPTGPIKIGYSANPWARIDNLQTGCPEPLTILAVIDGTAEKERELHGLFSNLSVSGEWFTPGTAILEYISSINGACAAPRSARKPRQFAGLSPRDIMKAINIHPSTFSRWSSGVTDISSDGYRSLVRSYGHDKAMEIIVSIQPSWKL